MVLTWSAFCYRSIGLSLTDTLDDLINEGRIEPQLAMKILSTFDRVITEVLAEKVQVKLSFKVFCPRFCQNNFTGRKIWRNGGVVCAWTKADSEISAM